MKQVQITKAKRKQRETDDQPVNPVTGKAMRF